MKLCTKLDEIHAFAWVGTRVGMYVRHFVGVVVVEEVVVADVVAVHNHSSMMNTTADRRSC